MTEATDRTRFEDWRLGYLNGTLSAEQKRWMDHYLRDHPERAADVKLDETFRAALREALPPASASDGLPAFMARVRADSVEPRGALRRWWQGFWPDGKVLGWQPAFAVPAVLLIAQTGIIAGMLLNWPDANPTAPYSDWRGVGSAAVASGPVLRITFKSAAKEADIRLLLVRIGGEIIGGPGQLGHYLVQVPGHAIDSAKKSVAADPSVEAVEIRSDANKDE